MLRDGSLRVPLSAYDPKTGAIGDAAKVIAPGAPGYDEWLPFVTRRERA